MHQVWSLDTTQLVFDTMLYVVNPAAVVTFLLEGVTASCAAAGAWVTVTVTGVRPEAVTVMVAVRCAKVVFAV